MAQTTPALTTSNDPFISVPRGLARAANDCCHVRLDCVAAILVDSTAPADEQDDEHALIALDAWRACRSVDYALGEVA